MHVMGLGMLCLNDLCAVAMRISLSKAFVKYKYIQFKLSMKHFERSFAKKC